MPKIIIVIVIVEGLLIETLEIIIILFTAVEGMMIDTSFHQQPTITMASMKFQDEESVYSLTTPQ